MKAAQFAYTRASAVGDALQLLAQAAGAAKPMSGSQSLGPMLNLRLARPAQVIDVASLTELRGVRQDGEWIEIGAAVTHAEIEDGVHPLLAEHPVRQVAAGIAYRAIRTRGTIGGSLAHADPAADWVVTLAALGARVTVRSPRSVRVVPADTFMLGAYTTVLEPDELIVSIGVPRVASSTRWGYHKLCRKPGEFAEASAAVYVAGAKGPVRIALGAVDGPPILLADLARAAAGAADIAHDQVRSAVRDVLVERDAVDIKLFTACVERALEQAGTPVRR